jgi:serine/threonine-protein kinase
MGLEAGTVIGSNLRLIRILAKGGMGSIWVAEHVRLKTQVAVKFIADLLSVDPTVQKRFALEAQAVAQIRSPHVVQVMDHGSTDEGTPYIVMELLDGESLGIRLLRLGRLELDETAAIVMQTSQALACAHAVGFIHRDIKPDNIFLTESNGQLLVKVLDFGIAKGQRQEHGLTRSGATLGTPRYMSPEQLVSAKHVTPRADLWSLAAVAYRALLGRAPFEGRFLAIGAAIARGKFALPSEIRSDLPLALDGWFRQALHVREVDRFSSAQELAETFARAAQVPLGRVVPARLPRRTEPPAIECGPRFPPSRTPPWPSRGHTLDDDEYPRSDASIAGTWVPPGALRQGLPQWLWIAGSLVAGGVAAVVALALWGSASPLLAAARTASVATPVASVAPK